MCTKRTDPNPPEAQVAAETLTPVNSTTAPGPSGCPEAKLPRMLMVNLFEKEALNVSHWRGGESPHPEEMNFHTLFACVYSYASQEKESKA